MPLDWKDKALAQGLHCYCDQQFFAAHEHWELVWLRLDEPEKSFLQALIQVTAAFHHLQRGNRAGAASLLRRALLRLQTGLPACGNIALEPLCLEITDWLLALDGSLLFPSAFPAVTPVTTNPGTLDRINP